MRLYETTVIVAAVDADVLVEIYFLFVWDELKEVKGGR